MTGIQRRAAVLGLAVFGTAAGILFAGDGPTLFFHKGIAFTGYGKDAYIGEGVRQTLRELAATGAGWVQILVTGYQDTAASTVIDRTGGKTPTDSSLVDVIRYAKKLGLRPITAF